MNFKLFLLTIILIPKNQNESMVTAIHLFSYAYEQLKVNNFYYLYFLPVMFPRPEMADGLSPTTWWLFGSNDS